MAVLMWLKLVAVGVVVVHASAKSYMRPKQPYLLSRRSACRSAATVSHPPCSAFRSRRLLHCSCTDVPRAAFTGRSTEDHPFRLRSACPPPATNTACGGTSSDGLRNPCPPNGESEALMGSARPTCWTLRLGSPRLCRTPPPPGGSCTGTTAAPVPRLSAPTTLRRPCVPCALPMCVAHVRCQRPTRCTMRASGRSDCGSIIHRFVGGSLCWVWCAYWAWCALFCADYVVYTLTSAWM